MEVQGTGCPVLRAIKCTFLENSIRTTLLTRSESARRRMSHCVLTCGGESAGTDGQQSGSKAQLRPTPSPAPEVGPPKPQGLHEGTRWIYRNATACGLSGDRKRLLTGWRRR